MEASQLFITSPILIGDVIKERLPIDPKLLKVAYTARYLCNSAKVAYDIRRLPEFEVCVRTQTCIGGIGGSATINSKWVVCSNRWGDNAHKVQCNEDESSHKTRLLGDFLFLRSRINQLDRTMGNRNSTLSTNSNIRHCWSCSRMNLCMSGLNLDHMSYTSDIRLNSETNSCSFHTIASHSGFGNHNLNIPNMD